jgi:hypothetical protein
VRPWLWCLCLGVHIHCVPICASSDFWESLHLHISCDLDRPTNLNPEIHLVQNDDGKTCRGAPCAVLQHGHRPCSFIIKRLSTYPNAC